MGHLRLVRMILVADVCGRDMQSGETGDWAIGDVIIKCGLQSHLEAFLRPAEAVYGLYGPQKGPWMGLKDQCLHKAEVPS